MGDIQKKAAEIRLVIFDVDGVLTDGKLLFDDSGGEYKLFHARDGLGIKLLQRAGIEVAVISGRKSESVALRMKSLGIEHVYQGQHDKLEAFTALLDKLKLAPEQAAHVGDDLLDIPLLRRVGLAVAVADANSAILPYADWQTRNPGGAGAAREVCDLILEAQGQLQSIIESFH